MARPLLASMFITGGINALRDAEGHAQAVKPVIDKTVDQAGDSVPEAVPTDPVTLVRIDGAVKLAAGTLLALGKFPRLAAGALLASLVPTTAAAHRFWEMDGDDRQQQTIQFLKNTSLAGGLLLAAADTEGKPSVGWRAKHAVREAGKQVQGTTDAVQKNVQKSQKNLQKSAGRAGAKAGKAAGKAGKATGRAGKVTGKANRTFALSR
ncbi:DoxX family protein [Prauserella shujinwangii]|uniref:DoxX family protein n=1 Tax=Prauserella shujinwangii TaxID=1453103 RepID=UPI001FE4E918|nr:DoxX family protein [Prauserella shujinwangii]